MHQDEIKFTDPEMVTMTLALDQNQEVWISKSGEGHMVVDSGETFQNDYLNDDHYLIPKVEGVDSYRWMHAFLDAQRDPQTVKILSGALASRSPFTTFTQEVDALGLSDAWKNFRLKRIREHLVYWIAALPAVAKALSEEEE